MVNKYSSRKCNLNSLFVCLFDKTKNKQIVLSAAVRFDSLIATEHPSIVYYDHIVNVRSIAYYSVLGLPSLATKVASSLVRG
jgi:hypothetical protein